MAIQKLTPPKKPGYQISKEHKEIFAKWFAEKVGDRECHICGYKKWYIVEGYSTDVAFDIINDRHVNSKVFLQLNVACSNCGVVSAFNAAQMGVVTKNTKDKPTETKPKAKSKAKAGKKK